MYDIVIIGGGAAGMSAAIYAARSGMQTLVIEALSVGGQMNYTYEVDNYLGVLDNPTGTDLSMRMAEHVKKFDVRFTTEKVRSIEDCDKKIKRVVTLKNVYETRAVIFATGANPRKLGVEGEDRFYGMGVSYCATCDGAFFKGQDVCIVGGGNTAFEDALYLARFSRNVYLIHRRDSFRAAGKIVESVKNNERIKIITDTVIDKINGDTTVSDIDIVNVKTGEKASLEVSAVFVAVGRIANSELAGQYVKLNNAGFIVTDREMQTNILGVYAAGDVRDTPLRQVITAASDGAIAATSAINYING